MIKKNISDIIPKTIMAFLVRETTKMANNCLVTEIYKSGNLQDLLAEDPMLVA